MRNFIKKFLLFVVSICAVLVSTPTLCYATQSTNAGGNNETYLKDYESYQELLNEFDDNTVNKNYYIEQLISELEEIRKNSEIKLYEAEIIEIDESSINYLQDATTSEYAMGDYQYGKIRITEKGSFVEGLEMPYMACLTFDVYNNIVLPDLEVGDTTYITLLQINEETLVAISPELDTYVERFPTMLVISIIILLGVMIYFGKHSVNFIVPIILMVDLLFGLVGPLVLQGFNLWLLVFFMIVLNAIAVSVLKVGANSKAFTAVFTTVVVCVTMAIVHFAVDALLNFGGLTSESFLLSSGVMPNIIASEVVPIFNFHTFSVLTTIIIMSVLVTLTACKVSEKMEEHKAKIKGEEQVRADVSKYISEISIIAVVVMLANALPKYMILLAKNYNAKFILQSEMFLIEFVRVLMVLLGMMLTVPISLLINKFIEDK